MWLFNVCSPCCTKKLGFVGSSFIPVTTCLPALAVDVNLGLDATHIGECGVVTDYASTSFGISSGVWGDFSAWLSGGGRLALIAGPDSGLNPYVGGSSLNSFLAFVGSTIRYLGGSYIEGGSAGCADYPLPVASLPLTTGFSTLSSAGVAAFTGGTPVAFTAVTSTVCATVEKIGTGWLLLLGGAHMVDGTSEGVSGICYSHACELWSNFANVSPLV